MAKISISDRQIVVTDPSSGTPARERPDYIEGGLSVEPAETDDWGNPMVAQPSEVNLGSVLDVPLEVFNLDPPTDIVVESQLVKISPDGFSRIDLLLSFQEVPDAVNYETRVTKE